MDKHFLGYIYNYFEYGDYEVSNILIAPTEPSTTFLDETSSEVNILTSPEANTLEYQTGNYSIVQTAALSGQMQGNHTLFLWYLYKWYV